MPRFCWWPLLVLFSYPVAAGDWHYSDVSRVVAVSDIHGDYNAMVMTFQKAGVIDTDLHWVGGETQLVITGDLLDRGPDSRQVMDLIMRLEGEATDVGGRVHQLIGNHEVMNLVGDLRYVDLHEYAAFADDESAKEREKWFQQYKRIQTASTGNSEQADGRDETVLLAAFDALAPPGFFGHRRAFRADGKYGKWLLEKPLMIVIDGTAFVHGGLSPYVAEHGLEGVNGILKTELRHYLAEINSLEDLGLLSPIVAFHDHKDVLAAAIETQQIDGPALASAKAIIALKKSSIHGSKSPLWYRGTVGCSEIVENDLLQSALDQIGANRVVIGHTPTLTRQILQRMNGRVFEIDTGMNKAAYKGSGNALVIEDGVLTVINEDGSSNSPPLVHPRRVGYRSSDISADDLLEMLSIGEITRTMTDEKGTTIVQIEMAGNSIFAAFTENPRRTGQIPELAAYKLDLMLGLDLVPVTVLRDVGRKTGTLQFLPAARKTEPERAASNSGGGAWCPLSKQWNAMYIFDALIFNVGRLPETMLYSPDNWQLFSMTHGEAFRNSKDRPAYLRKIELNVTPSWVTALEELTDERLQKEFDSILRKRELSALRKRRDRLIREASTHRK